MIPFGERPSFVKSLKNVPLGLSKWQTIPAGNKDGFLETSNKWHSRNYSTVNSSRPAFVSFSLSAPSHPALFSYPPRQDKLRKFLGLFLRQLMMYGYVLRIVLFAPFRRRPWRDGLLFSSRRPACLSRFMTKNNRCFFSRVLYTCIRYGMQIQIKTNNGR